MLEAAQGPGQTIGKDHIAEAHLPSHRLAADTRHQRPQLPGGLQVEQWERRALQFASCLAATWASAFSWPAEVRQRSQKLPKD